MVISIAHMSFSYRHNITEPQVPDDMFYDPSKRTISMILPSLNPAAKILDVEGQGRSGASPKDVKCGRCAGKGMSRLFDKAGLRNHLKAK